MMLTLKLKPFSHHRLHLNLPFKVIVNSPSFISFPSRSLRNSLSTTSMDPPTAAAATVEHVVLFKIRDDTDPSKIDAMITNLRALSSLPVVSHITAGPILRLRSAAASAFGFTHILHSRYSSKPDLAAYSSHPDHLAVVKENVLPIVDDITAVDWVSNGQFPAPPPGSALRLMLAKPKEGVATADVIKAIEGIKAEKAEQLSYGENFSPARAKGFSVGFMAVFKSVEELDALMEDGEMVEAQKEKVRPLLDSVIVLDYVMPLAQNASL